MKEIWKEVDWFDGMYLISNFGRLKSMHNNIIRKPFLKEKRYPKLVLNKNGKKYMRYIHRMVAIAFISNPKNKKQVNHIDGNKCNNNVSNLEWNTPSENMQHSIKNKLHPSGEKCSWAKLTEKQVIEIRKLSKNSNITHAKLGNIFGINQSAITNIINHKRWKHI